MRESFSGLQETILIKDIEPARAVSRDLTLPAKNFTELDRLAIVVHSIEHDCQVIPLGAVKMIPTHEIFKNKAFVGLTAEQAGRIESYVHFRKPESSEKIAYVASDEALSRPDFLD
jgi:radial spoke head protein 9